MLSITMWDLVHMDLRTKIVHILVRFPNRNRNQSRNKSQREKLMLAYSQQTKKAQKKSPNISK